jgi:heme o synthase
VLALVWYNGLYLFLKRTTAFAAVPGALVGAIPPVLGWCAAGGVLLDATILEVGFFFFIWQIPHFWLLAQVYGSEYEGAGFALPSRTLSSDQFRQMTSAWILAVAATGLVLAVTQRFGIPWNFLALGSSIGLCIATLTRRNRPGRFVALALFRRINIYAFVITVLLIANSL